MPERGFWIFFLFFSEFPCAGQVWTEFGTKIFFFLFLGQSHPVLAKNNVRKRYFNFFKFFAIFFGILLHESSMNGIRKSNFFLSFSAYLIPFWLKIMSERGILIFLNFLLFFSEFSCMSRVWMEFGSQIFFSLSRPISSCFG